MRMKLLRICKKTVKHGGLITSICVLLFLAIIGLKVSSLIILNVAPDDVSWKQNVAGHKARGIFGVNDKNDTHYYLSGDMSLESQKKIQKIVSDAYKVNYPMFVMWMSDNKTFCEDKISVHGMTLFRAKEIVLNTDYINAKADPGIDFKSVIGQKAQDEHYSFELGAFQIPCKRVLPYFSNVFHKDSSIPHIANWYRSIISSSKPLLSSVQVLNSRVYATVRYEYTNIYWVIIDLYNVFIHCILNKHVPSEVTVLLFDAHPRSPLDNLWKVVFGRVIRPFDLPKVTQFKDITWTISRSFSPFTNEDHLSSIPFIDHFRKYVLTRFYLDNVNPLNCSSLRVTFIWRHDYISHPRNPQGVISRKIENEAELINKTREAFPQWRVQGHQLDALSIFDQVKVVSQTDILIGMHGAAIAFNFLMRPGGAVIELFPKYHGFNPHMRKVADSAGLFYRSWINDDDALEDIYRKTTHIPPAEVNRMLGRVSTNMCSLRKGDFPNPSLHRKTTKKPQKGSKKVHVKTISKIKD